MNYSYCVCCGGELARRKVATENDRERLVCGKCGYIHYINPIPATAVVIEKEKKILLVRRAGSLLRRYGLDMVVANDLDRVGSDRHEALFIGPGEKVYAGMIGGHIQHLLLYLRRRTGGNNNIRAMLIA